MPPLTGWPARLGLLTAAGLLLVLAGLSRSSASGRLENTLLRERFTVGRLAGQKAWEPCAVADGDSLVPRTSCGPPLRDDTRRSRRVDAAEREARPELRSDSSARALRIEALLDLRSGKEVPAHLERAAGSLERARRLAPDDVVVLNDLAVAFLELGERDQQLMPMLRALDVIERAFARDSARPEVLFNRALIHERLYLVESAERGWKRYLDVERHPRWRAEPEAHARRVAKVADTTSWDTLLQSPPLRMDAPTRAGIAARVRRSPQAAREFCLKDLLRSWGLAVERGDTIAAVRLLTLAREVGTAADSLRGDRSVLLAVNAIDSSAGDRSRTQAAAQAHVELGRGLTLFGSDLHGAAASLQRADRSLRSLGSPAARWAAFYHAASQVQIGKYESADRRFRDVLAEATTQEPALVGKTIWGLGVSQLRRGHYETASQFYREAKPHIARAREPENQGALSYLLSESLSLAGQSVVGRAEVFHGLRILSPFRSSNFLNNHLTTVAVYAREEGLSYAALALMNEVMEIAHALGKPDVLAWALRARAGDLVALGRSAAARAELAEAMRWADQIKPGADRDRVRADVTLVLGQVMRRKDPRSALPLLLGVVETYRRLKLDLYLPLGLYEAALAAWAGGDPEGAHLRLHEAIEQIERQQASFETAEVRAMFYETVENVFDAMIELELERRRAGPAFDYLERGRAAIRFPDGQRTASAAVRTAGLGIDDVRALLPDTMLLVEYALLRDQVVAWTVSRRGWRRYSVPVPRDSVAALVDRLTQGTDEVEVGGTDAQAELFDLLIRPLAGELKGARQLVIVPDRELYRVPFVALRDRATGRYLLESHQVRTVPSAAFFVAASSRGRQAYAGSSALVVGNPALDPASVPRLPPLPGALREAEQVAQLYEGARLLSEAGARRSEVLELLPAHSVFHFAGHAVFNSEQPELSYLALASDGGEEGGILHAWEIGGLRLSNVRVVVLSACSTLSPRTSRTGVTAGLAYSFLRAGVPATISTLWDVSDQETTELMVEFHRRMSDGLPAAEALHQAQLQAVTSNRSGKAWAAFIYTGP